MAVSLHDYSSRLQGSVGSQVFLCVAAACILNKANGVVMLALPFCAV